MERIIKVKEKALSISYIDNSLGVVKRAEQMFFCPDCADQNITIDQIYCGNCGVKLAWEL